MQLWAKIRLVKFSLNDFSHRFVSPWSRSCRNMSDQMRQALLTRLGEIDFVTRPHSAALFTKTGIGLIRRGEKLRSRRNISRLSPPYLAIFRARILHPDQTEHLDRRNISQKDRGSLIEDIQEEGPAISTNTFCHLLTLGWLLWKECLLNTMPIAVQPSALAVSQQPIGSEDG